MKQEFKWILSIKIDVDTEDGEECYEKASRAMELAQDCFFDSLNDSATDIISDWEVIDEELK